MSFLGPSHLGNNLQYEAQRQNNFEIFIYGVAGSEHITLATTSAPAISESNEEVVLPYGNRDVKVAGKVTYDTGPLTLKDLIPVDIARYIDEWRRQVFDPSTDAIGFAANYKKEARVVEYAPDGSFARSWVLEGCWPQAVNYGTHDYSGSDAKAIEVTLSFDKAYRDV